MLYGSLIFPETPGAVGWTHCVCSSLSRERQRVYRKIDGPFIVSIMNVTALKTAD